MGAPNHSFSYCRKIAHILYFSKFHFIESRHGAFTELVEGGGKGDVILEYRSNISI